MGLKFVSEPKFDRDCILMANPSENIQNTPFLIYNPGNIVKNINAKVIAECVPPYFSRTYGHYCSHRNTPYDKNATRDPAMTKEEIPYDIHTGYITFKVEKLHCHKVIVAEY